MDRLPAPGPVLWVEANSLDGGSGRRGPVEWSHPWLGAHPGSEGNTHVSLNPAGITGLCPCGGTCWTPATSQRATCRAGRASQGQVKTCGGSAGRGADAWVHGGSCLEAWAAAGLSQLCLWTPRPVSVAEKHGQLSVPGLCLVIWAQLG